MADQSNVFADEDLARPDAVVVFITTPNREEASELAQMLVEARLAACVQILPRIDSIYRWQGRVERQEEVLLLAKTLRSKFADLEREVRARHSYETPEIVAVPVVDGSAQYLAWLTNDLGG